jgi:tetratricopeptide (TPR) repeat protein
MTPWILTFALVAAQPVQRTATQTSPDARGEAYYHFSMGQQARLLGEVAEALQHLRRAQKADPASGAIRAEMARVLREAGRNEEALAEATEAVRLEPDSAEARLMLAQLHLARSEGEGGEQALRAAASEFEEVARLEPEGGRTRQILLTLANMYRRLEEHERAIGALERYLALDGGSFDAHVRIGDHYLAMGDAEKAADAFKKALDLQPSAQAYEKLAESYAKADQPDQAILHYRKALELEPKSLKLHLDLGDVLLQARRPKEALAEAEAALGDDPHNRRALELKGRSLREQRRFDEAEQAADSLLAEEPGDLKAAYLKVTIAEARRDFAAAATGLETLLRRKGDGEDPVQRASNDRVFLIHLGFAYQQLGRFADAADAFGRASRVGGEPDAALLGYQVEALFLAKDYERALAEVRAARGRFPEDADLATQEANVLRARGEEPAALAIVEKLERQSPRDVDVLLQVAEFYQRAKRYGEAEAALRRAREVKPRELRTLFQLGAVLERQKRHDAAETVFREALTLQADSAPVLNYLGYMNADRGVRVEEAVGLIERALAVDPENGAYLDSLGWALFRLNRLAQAEEMLRKAVTKEPNAVVLDHLGDVLKRRGAIVEALDCWRKALKGEDEGEDLDRAVVEQKIREAQASLDAHTQPRP